MDTAAASNLLLFTPDLDSIRYTSEDGSYSALVELEEGDILKLSLSGVMSARDQLETDKLIETMISYYTEAGLNPKFYVLADVSKLISVLFQARSKSQNSVLGFYREGYIRHVVMISPNYILRTLFNLMRRFQPSLPFSTHKSLEQGYKKISELKKQNALSEWNKQLIDHETIYKIKSTDKINMESTSISNNQMSGGFLGKIFRKIRNLTGTGKNKPSPVKPDVHDQQDYQHLSKKELTHLLIEAREELDNVKKHQSQRLEELFRMISSISWDQEYHPPVTPFRSKDDPFYDIMDAAVMLQQDIGSMTRELKNLNSSLEEEVQNRTRELARKEANLSALVENTSDIILSANSNLEILVSNSSMRKISSIIYDKPFEPGANIGEILNGSQMAIWQPMLNQVLSGHVFKKVASIRIKGSEHFFEYSFNPIWEEDGVISGFSFFGKDVTKKEQAELEVRKQQQLLSSINKSIKEGIFRSAPGSKIIYVNEAFAKMFGYESVEEVLTLDPDDLYVDPSRRGDFHKLMEGDNDYFTNEEVKFKRKDGSIFWGLMSSIKAIDEKGNIYYDGAIRDVTKILEDERKIKEQNQKLIKVNRELDQFVYCTSHDLRAPLVSMKGLINIAKMEDTQEKRAYYFDLMINSINKLDGFIKDIMGYSKNARSMLKREEIDFQKLLEETIHGLQFAPESKKIESRIDIDIDGAFHSDPTRLEMIFNNVVSNAFRYSDHDKDNPYVSVRIRGNSSKIEVQICDNGIGIPEKSMDKIFHMFYRGTKKSEGSGIGLYIVKEAVEKVGGTIGVKSEEGKGTCFSIELPEVTENSVELS